MGTRGKPEHGGVNSFNLSAKSQLIDRSYSDSEWLNLPWSPLSVDDQPFVEDLDLRCFQLCGAKHLFHG